MKKKKIIILVLQILLVIASMFLMVNYVNGRVNPVEVFVYSSDFEDNNRELKDSDLIKVEVPAEAVNKNFVFDKEYAIGKVVNTTANKGQYVYKEQLKDKEEKDIFKSLDLTKLRKISLPINYQDAFAGEIKKGDTIDLLYVGQGAAEMDEDSGSGSFTYSKVFMSDVLVYSVTSNDGYEYVPHGESTGEDGDFEELGIVTLAVSLEDAEQIQARLNTGGVKFVGRFDESQNYDTLGYVMGEYGKVFSGKAFAETDRLDIVEDEFQEITVKEEK